MSRITVPVLTALIAISAATLALGKEAATAANADEQAVRQVTQDFVKAFNAGSAEKAAALFYGGAELIDDAGNVHKGAAAIKEVLGRFFEKFPGATSTMTADSVWMVSPGLAIEEGKRVVSTKDDKSSAATLYIGDDQAAGRMEDRLGSRGQRRRRALAPRPAQAAGMARGRLGR